MNYKEQLNRLISESGLTIKDIVKRCEEFGEKVTTNYISVLKNQDGKIPSDNLSIALAKACNSQYEEILLVQGFLDRAPTFIIKPLEFVHDKALISAEHYIKRYAYNMPQIQRTHEIKRLNDELKKNDLATFICEFNSGAYDKIDMAIDKIFDMAGEPPEYKWALVKIQNESDIRVLDANEIDEITKKQE